MATLVQHSPIDAAILAERERCAKIAEQYAAEIGGGTSVPLQGARESIAIAIRGDKETDGR